MDLAYLSALPMSEFKQRRQTLLAQLPENSLMLVFTASEKMRNRDCEYPFRPDSHFWYLTGFAEPESALVLRKINGEAREAIFVRERDPAQEQWTGKRLGVANAPEKLACHEAFSIEDLPNQLTQWAQTLSQTQTDWAFFFAPVHQPWGAERLESLENLPPAQDWQPIVSEMRLFKSEAEVALLQQACQISALGHLRAMKQLRPNRYEWEIEGEILHEFNRFGARFCAYNTIVGGGENGCILHYVENDSVLRAGELVLIDAGAEFAYYAGDITRTLPINGRFSPEQRALYQLVLDAMKAASALLIPQSSIQAAQNAAVRVLTEGLVALGILQGEVSELIENEAYKVFYMHGIGHWLGLDVHDVGDYGEARSRPLEVGMVLTVEPGLYISDDADVPEAYRGIGIRIEDNLLITEYGNKNLTCAAPKEIADIEAIMAAESAS